MMRSSSILVLGLLSLSLTACENSLFSPAGPLGDAAGKDGQNGEQDGDSVLVDRKPEDCPEEYDYFVSRIWEPVLSVQCVGCHNAKGPASASNMVFKTPDEEDYLAFNYRVVSTIASQQLGDTSVFLLRPSGRHPDGHTGGELVPEHSTTYAALSGFVSQLQDEACAVTSPLAECGAEVSPGARQLRRLTRAEYDATVSDLLGVSSTEAQRFTPENVVHGFDNIAAALTVSPLLADQLFTAAEKLASLAVSTRLASLVPCAPAAGNLTCATAFVEAFGLKTFRRPLSSEEVTRYVGLYEKTAGDGFAAGIQTVISTMLQSPHFLYRSELGSANPDGSYSLTSYEVASELSYLLWGTMPDDLLFEAAKKGELSTHEQLKTQALRLLGSPRAKQTITRFMEQWLDVTTLPVVSKDSAIFPELTGEVRTSMKKELETFAAHVVLDGPGTLTDLLTSRDVFVDPTLASFHGLSVPVSAPTSGDMARVTLPEGQASGVLTLSAVLTTHARTNESSPIKRGRMVRERLLCQKLPDPPPGVNATPPPLDPSLSVRDRFAAHAAEQPCLGCHRLIDPIGFAFEHFDGIGRYRENENGRAIDDSGEIVSSAHTNGKFTGIVGLSDKLADSPDVADCFVTQWFRFAYGVEENKELSCLLGSLQKRFRESDGSVVDLIVSMVETPRALKRVGAQVTAPSGAESPTSEPTSGGSTGGTSEPTTPTPEPTPTPTQDLTIKQMTDSTWETGYCNTVIVTNGGKETVTWKAEISVMGKVTQIWNATYAEVNGKVVAQGVEWNRELAPGKSADFGYCASK